MPTEPPTPRPSAEEIIARGEQLYAERHKARLERTAHGHFAVIDIETGEIYVALEAEAAVAQARAAAPTGVLHLMKIGSAGAYRRLVCPKPIIRAYGV